MNTCLKSFFDQQLRRHGKILGLCLSGLILYSFLLGHRYVHFAYDDWDMAFTNQELWNLLQGNTYSTLFGFHCFGSHAEFINLVVLPIFAVFPSPLTFSFVQLGLFLASVFVLFLILKEDIGETPALLLSFSYMMFAPNLLAMCHDHNSEALMPFFFLMAFRFFRNKNLTGFYISLLFLLLIKENMPLILIMFGLYGIISRDRNRWWWGGLPILVGSAYFLFLVKCLIPWFRGMQQHSLWIRFYHIGGSPREIIFNLLNPVALTKILLAPANVQFLKQLFGAFLPFAILSPLVLGLVAPILCYHLLSASLAEKSITYYYALAMTPAIFLASGHTLKKWVPRPPLRTGICLVLLLCSLGHLVALKGEVFYKIGWGRQPLATSAAKWQLLKQVPPEAGVIATFEFLPALSLRKDLYSFHQVFDRAYQDPERLEKSEFYTGAVFTVPESVTYAVLDMKNPKLQHALRQDHEFTQGRLDLFFKDWTTIGQAGDVVLLKRR